MHNNMCAQSVTGHLSMMTGKMHLKENIGQWIQFQGKQLWRFYFLPPVSKEVNSFKKEFAPGSKFFPVIVELFFFVKGYFIQGSKQEVAKIVYLCKNG